MNQLKSYLLPVLFFGGQALACEPIRPAIIPPLTPDGEFQYVYPDYQKELNESVRTAKDVAVVKLHSDSVSESEYGYQVAVAILELLHGWGYQSGRYMKYVREESSCGKPKEITGSGWFVALLRNNEVYAVIPYSAVQQQIKSKGKPEYVYSAIGLIKD
ncbi:hypothetical protein [Microbulbifer pacificus]|uniref:hypothetical protein n=1 Tax=Microbulbifer pacificus TaxID=407164 RepID=UPI00131A0C6C|nr:hypothetical protein [Microbulbifer pacificus]